MNKAEVAGTSGPLGKSADANPGFIVMSGGTIRYTTSNQHDSSGRFSTAASQAYNIAVNGEPVVNASALTSSSGTLTHRSPAGGGTLTMGGANPYTGITNINGGTLNVSSDGNLGTAPAAFTANQITLNGGTLQLTATAVDLATNRGISVTAASTISASSSQSPLIEGIISGSAPLTKTSSGNLSLNGANTFSGGLTITGGGVRFNNNQAAGTGTITITPASIVTLRNITPPSAATTTLTNAITLNASGGNDVDLTVATGNTLALTGPISGAGYFTRGRASGAGGTILLSGNNSGWSGGLIFEDGILSLGSSNALGTGTLSITPATFNAVILESSTL